MSPRRARRLARTARKVATTFAISAAAHLFMVHSSLFTASASTSCDVVAAKGVFDLGDEAGVEPVAATGVRRGAPDVASTALPVPDDDALSTLALEVTRRAAGTGLDIPCSTTVPPPLTH